MERTAEPRPTRHRWVVAGLAAAGVAALVAGLTWGSEDTSTSKTPGRQGTATNQNGVVEPGSPGKRPSTGPGGVGRAPERTGLPAVPAPGGRVRTGTREQGCFSNIREYIDEWDRTGVEPDPCFTSQPPSGQPQPDTVKRSYNGERF